MRYPGSEGEGAGSSVARSICSRQSVACLVLRSFLGQQLICLEMYYPKEALCFLSGLAPRELGKTHISFPRRL